MSMPRTAGFLLVALAFPPAAWCAHPAREALADGIRLYENGSFEAAAGKFDEAAQGTSPAKLDIAVPRYNQGNALIRANRPDQAAQAYADALRSADLSLQSKAYFNRGNALVQMSAAEESKDGLDTASRALDEALGMYENSMALDPRDEDAKVNYELALKLKEQLQQKQQQQQQQKEGQDDQQKEDEEQSSEQQQGQDRKEQQQQQEQQAQQQQPQQEQQASQEQAQPSKPSEAMTPEEAAMVLDAMKQEEQAKREQLKLVIGQPMPVEKDW